MIRALMFLFLANTLVFSSASATLPIENLQLPPGFSISVFAENITGARSLAKSPQETLFVGTKDEGKVYALVDKDKDGKAEKVYTLLKDLNMPNGLAFFQGDLYVAEVHRIIKLPQVEKNLSSPPNPQVVYAKLPTDEAHGWRYIGIGPDHKLYVAVGAPCNICLKENEFYASIIRMDLQGSNAEVFAQGIRNSVGFDWNPVTQELWFTDNGRDWMGDDSPPDELNRASQKGQHFGFPYRHGNHLKDSQFGEKKPQSLQDIPPAQGLGAHVAALGMRFYQGKMFPPAYRNQIFIAEHGSWNRSKKSGHQISLVKHDNEKGQSYAPFIKGWETEGKVWGRPVDLIEWSDGSLLVSDDYAHAIYKISYK